MKPNNSDLFNKEVDLATKHNQEVTKILMKNLNNQTVKSIHQQKDFFRDSLSQYRIKTN
ncbi:Uncharacterised protein [Vibrio mimicus]|nr:Uncharacterised protein [Vibrio mimicus]